MAGGCLVLGAGLAIVLGHGASGSPQPTDNTGILALLGLFIGCALLIDASRSYLLGIGGAITCGFVAILLSTYSGLVINASSSVVDPVGLSGHVDRPAVLFAMLGYLAALLLLVSPWSRQRTWIQPLLVAGSILLTTVVLLTLASKSLASPTDVTARFVGRDDPLLLLGVIGIAFVAPIQVAGSVGWVYVWIWGASKLREQLRRPQLEIVALSAWALWLLLGVTGALPNALGGQFRMWSVMRDAGPRAWVLAGLVTLAAGVCAQRFHACLERSEGVATSVVALTIVLGFIGLAFGIFAMLLCALMTFAAEPVGAAGAVALLTTALAIATPMVWFGRAKKTQILAIGVGSLLASVGVLAAALAWPAAVNSATLPGIFSGRGINFFYLGINSNLEVVAILFFFPLTFVLAAIAYAAAMRKLLDFTGKWSGTLEYGVAWLLLPLAVWMILGAALLLPSALAHPKQNAFAAWPLPDPSIVAVVASALVALIALVRRAQRRVPVVSDRWLIGVVAISGAAFVPYLVPTVFRAGGRLALAGLAIQLLATAGLLGVRRLPPSLRRRNIRWQLAAMTLTIPLLIHVAASAGYTPTYVSGIFAQIGNSNGPGLFSNLREIIVVPLVVALMLADRSSPQLRERRSRYSVWRAYEADLLVEWVRDDDLETVSGLVGYHLRAVPSEDLPELASWLARTLGRRYRVRRATPRASARAPQASREQLNAALNVVDRALKKLGSPDEITRARATAEMIIDSAESSPHRADVRPHIGATIEVALGARTDAVEVLTNAATAEIEAEARRYLAIENRSEREVDHARALYRNRLSELMDALPRRFSLFKDPSAVALTPALVLDDRDHPQWIVERPLKHPYRYVAVLIGMIAASAIGLYYATFVFIRLGPHIVHLR